MTPITKTRDHTSYIYLDILISIFIREFNAKLNMFSLLLAKIISLQEINILDYEVVYRRLSNLSMITRLQTTFQVYTKMYPCYISIRLYSHVDQRIVVQVFRSFRCSDCSSVQVVQVDQVFRSFKCSGRPGVQIFQVFRSFRSIRCSGRLGLSCVQIVQVFRSTRCSCRPGVQVVQVFRSFRSIRCSGRLA